LETNLGEEVATLATGNFFGELALLHDTERAASVVCLEECEFLVIDKMSFRSINAANIAKNKHLQTYLPGMASVPANKHPGMSFKDQTCDEGHTFFLEGAKAPDAAIYLIHEGTVQFRRYKSSSDNAAYVFSNSPLAETVWGSPVRPWTSAPDMQKAAQDASRQLIVDSLGPGDYFCSLPAFPIDGPEPFSVVAVSTCKVYCAKGSEVLKLPIKLLKPLRASLMKDMSRRLKVIPGSEAERILALTKPAKSPWAISEPVFNPNAFGGGTILQLTGVLGKSGETSSRPRPHTGGPTRSASAGGAGLQALEATARSWPEQKKAVNIRQARAVMKSGMS